jgi:hypothetical protein
VVPPQPWAVGKRWARLEGWLVEKEEEGRSRQKKTVRERAQPNTWRVMG